jgi:hypothetical protein
MDQVSMNTTMLLFIDSIKNSHNLKNLCANLTNSLVQKFGGVWLCFACKQFLGNFHVQNIKKEMTHFTIADMDLFLFQAKKLVF